MRKHREAGTIETPPEMAARSQTTAVPPTPPPAVETPAETHNLASPSPQPAPPAGADADPISRRLDQIMRKHREAGTIETPPEMAARSQTTAVPPPRRQL
ncbi:MAG: hypothetical protein M5U34_05935 [Chloroflexi bacterium]|nr:hypothetical protein [Chloroflexota bacterium]